MDGDEPVPLVLNESVFTVFADPSQVTHPDKIVSSLRKIAGGNLVDSFETGLRDKKLQYTVLAKQVTRSQAELIKKEDLAGIGLQEASRRVYPESTLAAHLLGYVDADGNGQYGVENALQNRLAGKVGMLQTVTDVRRIPLTIGNNDVRVPAKNGDDLVLTIDRNIQAHAERLLKEGLVKSKATKGSVLVMDPRDGSVLAMANMPTYDPSKYTEVSDYAVFQNGVVSTPYENGSVIKTLTMGAALDSGAIGYNDTFNNTGVVRVDDSTIRNVEEDPVNSAATMTDILRYSLNTGVVYALEQMGGGSVNKQARDTLYHYFYDQYRFGKKTGIEQAGEAAGTIIGPDEGYGLNVRYANMTFGQGMDITMIQAASAFSASINGGTFYQPHLIGGTLGSDGSVKKTNPAVIASNVLRPEISAQLKEMIYQGRKQGFFGRYDKDGYVVGGKTGTSQVIDAKTGKYSDQDSIGTYIGFGATDTPSYVIMVKVDDSQSHTGYEGTTAAGPIFNDLSNWMIDYLQIQPTQ
ncbi:penicillin-binding protein 2 [Pedobacter sp.]|nr:penicillin-binding protein 2 [Candidatus Saccharibacteria bacterium]